MKKLNNYNFVTFAVNAVSQRLRGLCTFLYIDALLLKNRRFFSSTNENNYNFDYYPAKFVINSNYDCITFKNGSCALFLPSLLLKDCIKCSEIEFDG